MCDLDHLVSCRCRKHQRLTCQEGGFAACIPLDVLMVHSSALVVSTYDKHLTCDGFSLGETIHFGHLDFITNGFGGLSLSPSGNDSCATFMGSPRSRPLHQGVLHGFKQKGGFGFPSSRRHGMGAPPAPIAIMPWLKDAPATQP
jgi:hypothetical protein